MRLTSRRCAFAAVIVLVTTFASFAFAQDRPKQGGGQVPEGVELTQGIEYAKAGEIKLLLDIYTPKDAKEALPLIVWIHGGGWRQGDKFPCPAARMAPRGYVVASVNYRLTDKAAWPAQIRDCKAAVRFLRANAEKFHIDPKRVGAWGSSAGGHLVAMMGTSGDVKELEGELGNPEQSSRVQAVCDFFGPTDFTVMGDGGHGVEMVAKLLGGPLSENKEKAAQASPVTHVTKDDPPFLMMHGDKDPLVPLNQSEILEKGAGHGFKGGEEVDPVVDEFFDRHLKNDAAKVKPEEKKNGK
jgi:acetyl esterase/lipase